MTLADSQSELDLAKEIKTNSKRFLTTKIKREQRKRMWCGNSASIGAKIKVNLDTTKKPFDAVLSNHNGVVHRGEAQGLVGIRARKWKLS